jgi:hypothetical protein
MKQLDKSILALKKKAEQKEQSEKAFMNELRLLGADDKEIALCLVVFRSEPQDIPWVISGKGGQGKSNFDAIFKKAVGEVK